MKHKIACLAFGVILPLAGMLAGCRFNDAPTVDVGRAVIDARIVIRQAAESRDPLTRCHAIEAMADVSPGESGGVFIQAMGDKNPVIRFAAVMAIGDAAYAPAKSRLAKMAQDKKAEPDKRVFCAVIYALHRLGDDSYMPGLSDLLFDNEPEVRADAAMVMGKIGDPSAIGPLKAMLAEETDKNEAVRLAAREALATLGDSRSQVLMEAYTKGYFLDLRLAAIPAFAKTNPGRAAAVLRGLIANDKAPRVRVVAAGALAELGEVDQAGYDLCVSAMANPLGMLQQAYGEGQKVPELEMSSLQALAAIAAGNMKRTEVIGVLQPLLTSGDGGVRVAAALSILKLGDAGAGMAAPEIVPAAQEPTTQAVEPISAPVKLHSAGGKD